MVTLMLLSALVGGILGYKGAAWFYETDNQTKETIVPDTQCSIYDCEEEWK